MTEKTQNEEPKVYVACLTCYNEGRHHGRWMDADELGTQWEHGDLNDDGSYPMTKCKRLHHEEWAIHDYDSVPSIGEHPDIPHLLAVMRCIEEHGKPFFEWFNLDAHNKSHHDDLSEAFEEAYCGEWESPKAFAEDYADDLGLLPSHDEKNPNPLFRFVDFEWWWKSDLRHSFDFSNGHVFRGDV